MRFHVRRELKRTKIEIIPMIDTMFFLLVFFILAALNIIDLRGLYLNLPSAAPGTKKGPQPTKLEVNIDASGNMSVNGGSPLEKGRGVGKAMLEAIKEQTGDVKETTLIIIPQAQTQHEYLIRCVDDARGVGIEKFSVR